MPPTIPPELSLNVPAPYAKGYKDGTTNNVVRSDHWEQYLHTRTESWGHPLEFKRKRFNDVFFLLFFLAQLGGFIAVTVLVVPTWIKEGGLGGGLGSEDTGTSISLNRHTLFLLLLIIAAAFTISSLYLFVVSLFAKSAVHVTLILSLLLNIGICAYYWTTRFFSGAIIFTIVALFTLLAYFGYRARIPLAGLFFQVVLHIAKTHFSVYLVAFTAMFLHSALSVWLTFTVIATYVKYTTGNPSCIGPVCTTGTVAGLVFFELFSYLWTSQVIANVALATLAGGPFGVWYYLGPGTGHRIPRWPTIASFFRASTYSLGSIALGSLLVAFLEFLRFILSAIRNGGNSQGHPLEICLICCTDCFLGLIESIFQYFNRYAYIEVALYGKPFSIAAKDTWRLLKHRGVDALVNDSLVANTLTWGAYVVGLLTSLFGYLYLRLTHPAYNTNQQYTAPVVLISFLIGLTSSLSLSAALEAGVSTIFVGIADHPELLAIRSPPLFELIRKEFPFILAGVTI